MDYNEEKVVYEKPTTVVPNKFKPISAWGYIGYQLLFSIPLIGLIFMLVFAFGGTNNINLKNYARSFLIWILIGLVISLFVGLIFLVLMLLAGSAVSMQ